MKNLFEDVVLKSETELAESADEQQLRLEKRNEIYSKYNPLVNEVLEMFITAHRQGVWEKDSDCLRTYCCHISWFAGPKEKYTDPYDVHHTLRRRLEIKLLMDGLCNPTGFKVTNYEAIERTISVGLTKDELVRGIKAVMN